MSRNVAYTAARWGSIICIKYMCNLIPTLIWIAWVMRSYCASAQQFFIPVSSEPFFVVCFRGLFIRRCCLCSSPLGIIAMRCSLRFFENVLPYSLHTFFFPVSREMVDLLWQTRKSFMKRNKNENTTRLCWAIVEYVFRHWCAANKWTKRLKLSSTKCVHISSESCIVRMSGGGCREFNEKASRFRLKFCIYFSPNILFSIYIIIGTWHRQLN